MKKIIFPLVSAAIVLSAIPLNADADENDTRIAYTGGFSIYYYLNENSEAVIVSISGETDSDTVKIPSDIAGYTVTGLADRSLFKLTQLTSATLPDTLTYIGEYAFSGCLALKSVRIPESVESLGTGCFMSCTALESVYLNNKISEIPERCFYSCSDLSEIDIPENVNSIGIEAFFGCSSLSPFSIPESVESIGENAAGMHYDIRNRVLSNISGFVIKSKAGSAAHTYALRNNIEFVSDGTVEYKAGDINGDTRIDAGDASDVLSEYSRLSTGETALFTAKQILAADWNTDGSVDASDASAILTEYSRLSTTNA